MPLIRLIGTFCSSSSGKGELRVVSVWAIVNSKTISGSTEWVSMRQFFLAVFIIFRKALVQVHSSLFSLNLATSNVVCDRFAVHYSVGLSQICPDFIQNDADLHATIQNGIFVFNSIPLFPTCRVALSLQAPRASPQTSDIMIGFCSRLRIPLNKLIALSDIVSGVLLCRCGVCVEPKRAR